MRPRSSRKLAAGAIMAAVCLAVFIAAAVPAGAAAVYAAQFQGCTTGLTPVQLVGGTGSYSFSSGACSNPVTPIIGCTAVGVASNPAAGASQCSINASGTYLNITCGTGLTGGGPLAMTDTSTVSTTGLGVGLTDTVNIKYGIVFVSGVGLLRGQVTSSTYLSTGANVAGVVQITPTSGNCVTPVQQFIATGASVAAG